MYLTRKAPMYAAPECRVVGLREARILCQSGVTIPGNWDENTLFDEN